MHMFDRHLTYSRKVIFANLAESLYQENEGQIIWTGQNQSNITLIIKMFSAMEDIYEVGYIFDSVVTLQFRFCSSIIQGILLHILLFVIAFAQPFLNIQGWYHNHI
jgi:hypothetical protein